MIKALETDLEYFTFFHDHMYFLYSDSLSKMLLVVNLNYFDSIRQKKK